MSKPTFPAIDAGTQGWDGNLTSWQDVLTNQGVPLAAYATIVAWDALVSQRDDTLAKVTVNDDTDYTGPVVVYGDAGTTKKLAWQTATQAAVGALAAITDPVDTPATADVLRDDLVANALPEIVAHLDTLQVAHDALLTKLKAAGTMAS